MVEYDCMQHMHGTIQSTNVQDNKNLLPHERWAPGATAKIMNWEMGNRE